MTMQGFIIEMKDYLMSIPLAPFWIVKYGVCDVCGAKVGIFFNFVRSDEILALFGIGRENFKLAPDNEGELEIQKTLCLKCFKKWFPYEKGEGEGLDYPYIWLRKIISESNLALDDIKEIARELELRFYFVRDNLYVCGCGFVSGTHLDEDADYWDVRDELIEIHNQHISECPLLLSDLSNE